MIRLDQEKMSIKDIYKVVSGTVIPRPIALVTTINDDGLLNIAPFSFFNVVSKDPAILSISILRNDGELKDTAKNIFSQKEAVVHIVDTENVSDANETAAKLPSDESEITNTNFTTVDSLSVKTKGLKQSKVRFEVTLYDSISVKNKEGIITSDLILLKVEEILLNENIYENGYINVENLSPVARLAGSHYAKLGEKIELIRP